MHSLETLLICNSQHQKLGLELSSLLQIPLIYTANTSGCANKHVFILHSASADIRSSSSSSSSTIISANSAFLQLLAMVRQAQFNHAKRITVITPSLPYARQDKQIDGLCEPITAKLVAQMLQVAGASDLLCIELHSAQIQAFFDIPVHPLSINGHLAALIEEEIIGSSNSTNENVVIVSPDVGGVSRATEVGKLLGCPVAVIYKERNCLKVNSVSRMLLVGDVKGKVAVIVDDMVDTCGTLLLARETLITDGGASTVHAVAVHGILSGDAIERIEKSEWIDSVLVSNSVPVAIAENNSSSLSDTKEKGKIRVFSIGPMLASAIEQHMT